MQQLTQIQLINRTTPNDGNIEGVILILWFCKHWENWVFLENVLPQRILKLQTRYAMNNGSVNYQNWGWSYISSPHN